eukprot:scaffold45361_cov59-Phaeocystis_antarctica.AAC.5
MVLRHDAKGSVVGVTRSLQECSGETLERAALPFFEIHPGGFCYPPKLGLLGRDSAATRARTSLHVALLSGSSTPVPAVPGTHAVLASTRGGAPALLRQNAGLDHAGRLVRSASSNRTRRAA